MEKEAQKDVDEDIESRRKNLDAAIRWWPSDAAAKDAKTALERLQKEKDANVRKAGEAAREKAMSNENIKRQWELEPE